MTANPKEKTSIVGLSCLLLSIVMVHCACIPALAQNPIQHDSRKTPEEIVLELHRGVSTGDTTAWHAYMAPDAIVIDRDGSSKSKEVVLGEIRPLPKGRTLELIPQVNSVHSVGSTAIVSFEVEERLTMYGQTLTTKYPSVMYFEKRNDRWQLVFFTYFERPVDPPRINVDKSYLQSFAGIYELSPETKIAVDVQDSSLVYKRIGASGPGTRLYPIDTNGHFFRAGTETEFIFGRDREGRSILMQRRNWIDMVWRKTVSEGAR